MILSFSFIAFSASASKEVKYSATSSLVTVSAALATTAPVVATPNPTSTDATPTLTLRNEYFLLS